MKKMLFVRTSTPARGDGSGPTFEKGTAYWMRNSSAAYWMSEGAAVDAPDDMVAENDPPPEKRFAETVRIVPARSGRFNVTVGGIVANEQPMSAAAAEELRRDIIAGRVTPRFEAPPASAPAAAMVDEPELEPEPEPPEVDDHEDREGEAPATETFEAVHLGFGRYNVVASDGAVRNDAPLSKRAAADLIADLTGQL